MKKMNNKRLWIIISIILSAMLVYLALSNMYLWDLGVSSLCNYEGLFSSYALLSSDRSKYTSGETIPITIHTAFAEDLEDAYPADRMYLYLQYHADSGGSLEDDDFVVTKDFDSYLDIRDVPDEQFVVQYLPLLFSPKAAMPFSFDVALMLKENAPEECSGELVFTMVFCDAFDNPCGSSRSRVFYYRNGDHIYLSDIEDAEARGRFVP